MKRETSFKALLLITILFGLSGCSFTDYELYGPDVFYDDYSKVWAAAIDTLDEAGYVIVQMRRSDGYISTDRRERGGWRVKLSLRFYNTEGDGVQVQITDVCELKSESTEYASGEWKSVSCSIIDTSVIRKKIERKLRRMY
jgi:hypothetical protein